VTKREAYALLGLTNTELTNLILAFRAEIKRETQHLIRSFQ
jgi:hypothetical protein